MSRLYEQYFDKYMYIMWAQDAFAVICKSDSVMKFKSMGLNNGTMLEILSTWNRSLKGTVFLRTIKSNQCFKIYVQRSTFIKQTNKERNQKKKNILLKMTRISNPKENKFSWHYITLILSIVFISRTACKSQHVQWPPVLGFWRTYQRHSILSSSTLTR